MNTVDHLFVEVLDLVCQRKTDEELKTSLALLLKCGPWPIKVPKNRYQTNQFLQKYSPVQYEQPILYECCIQHCVLYRLELEPRSVDKCPVCQEDRYEPDGKPRCLYPYIPIVPRLKRMFASRKWSQWFEDQFQASMVDHGDTKEDIYDGTCYKRIMNQVGYSKYNMPFFFGKRGERGRRCGREGVRERGR